MRHKSATGPLQAKKVPDPLPIVTKYFIALKSDMTESIDGRIFNSVDDAHKAQDELGEMKPKTCVISFNESIGRKKLTSNIAGTK